MKTALVLAVAALSLEGCLTVDPSKAAVASSDFTLVSSAGQGPPRNGIDAIRVQEGARIEENWTLVLPTGITSGEVRVRYKDKAPKVYAMKGSTLVIPWKDIVEHDIWTMEDDAPVQALGSMRYTGKTDDQQFVDVMALAFIVVLQRGYSPMPINSGAQTWQTKCVVQYSTAGRSAILCK